MSRPFLAHRPYKTGQRLGFPLDVGDSGFSKTMDILATEQLIGSEVNVSMKSNF